MTTPTYTIGGMVIGLIGSGLVLQDNGGDDFAVSATGRAHLRSRPLSLAVLLTQ